jgi:hypothetical protein
MASILRVNTLTDASSNNSVALETVASGSAKAFSLTAADGASITDSFNVSGLTDTASGQQTIAFNNDFSSANHIVNANNGSGVDHFVTISTKAAGTQLLKSYDAGAAAFVDSIINMTAHGDLA